MESGRPKTLRNHVDKIWSETNASRVYFPWILPDVLRSFLIKSPPKIKLQMFEALTNPDTPTSLVTDIRMFADSDDRIVDYELKEKGKKKRDRFRAKEAKRIQQIFQSRLK